MATKVLQTISIYRQDGKDGVAVCQAPGEEASSTWKAGAALQYVDATSKELRIWSSTDSTAGIVGFAAKDATGTTGAAVPYYEANDSNLFAASMYDATDSTYALTGLELGAQYSLKEVSDNFYLNVHDATSGANMSVVGLIDAVGDINPRVIARMVQADQANVL